MDEKEFTQKVFRHHAKTLEFVPILDVVIDDTAWQAKHDAVPIPPGQESLWVELMLALADPAHPLTGERYQAVMAHYAKLGIPWLSKGRVLDVYRRLCDQGFLNYDEQAVEQLQKKPTRSQAGVTVVTVLTKPFPCPGQCIFCPNDVRMPKSYLHDEPGAQRAERHQFDPYEQTASRIAVLDHLGHPTDKIELIILGGTWSSYRRDYQEWFIKRCFDAMNGVDSADLPTAQAINATTHHRNVGLVIETRQDHISAEELRWLRYLGVTKVQVGIQSMDETVLALNKRGHTASATRDAFRLLRLAGFKIHGHWMANLLGGTPEGDRADYLRLWDDPALRPDELKIYPCMLLANTDLYQYYLRGEYHPYSEDEITDILVHCLANTPRYVRLTRVIRDIPTNNVVDGFKKANLRQIAEQRLLKQGGKSHDIRSREVRRNKVKWEELHLELTSYQTDSTVEHFLSYETADEQLIGFLRLSFPNPNQELPIPELENHAMIREVHVYGPVMSLGSASQGEAQHMGVGTKLIQAAKTMSKEAGYAHLAVISAIGTQNYYAKHGFHVNGLYMTTPLMIE